MADPSQEIVVIERRGPVLVVTMNRPQRLNGLNEPTVEALLSVFEGAARDPAIRVVVLAGAGRSFMAGADLSAFQADPDGAPRTAERLIDLLHGLERVIAAMPQPVVAAVQGPVAGGGVGVAMACDLVIAADDATFLSAYTKLGTNPDGGTTWTLTQLLGPRRALGFILLNEPMDAATALGLGLVNEVVPAGDLMAAVLAMAERLAAGSPGANGAAKRLVRAASSSTFDAQLDREKAAFIANAASPDFREGIQAFFEKRPAQF